MLLLLFCLPAKASESSEAALRQLVVDYLKAVVTKDASWLAEHATARSLQPYETLRQAALYARPGDLLKPPRENGCFQEPTVVLVLTLRAVSSAEELEDVSKKEVFVLLSRFLFPRLYPVNESAAQTLLDELENDSQALLDSSVLVQVAGDKGHATLKHDAAMSYLSLLLPSRMSAFTDEVIKQDAANFPQPLRDPSERLFAERAETGEWLLNLARVLKMTHYYAIRREDYWEMDREAFGERVERDLVYSLGEASLDDLIHPLREGAPGQALACPYQDLSD